MTNLANKPGSEIEDESILENVSFGIKEIDSHKKEKAKLVVAQYSKDKPEGKQLLLMLGLLEEYLEVTDE